MTRGSLTDRHLLGGVGLLAVSCRLLTIGSRLLAVALHILRLERAHRIGDLIVRHVLIATEVGTFECTLWSDYPRELVAIELMSNAIPPQFFTIENQSVDVADRHTSTQNLFWS